MSSELGESRCWEQFRKPRMSVNPPRKLISSVAWISFSSLPGVNICFKMSYKLWDASKNMCFREGVDGIPACFFVFQI